MFDIAWAQLCPLGCRCQHRESGQKAEVRYLRAGVKRVELREDFAQMSEVARVVPLPRLELYDCKVY